MPTFTDRATRILKQQKAERPKIGNGLPPVMDGFEGENRIQMVDGNPRLYYRTKQGWYYTGLAQDGEDPDLPKATSTTLGLIKIGSGGTVSSDGTYTATAATPAADDITSGDAAVSIDTSASNIVVDSNAGSVTIDGHTGIVLQGTNTKTITMGDGSSNFFVFNQDSTPEIDITGNFTIDCSGNITIDADGGTITFSDAGSGLGTITSSGYSGVAAVATAVTITDNENTNENNAIIFTAGGDLDGGNLGLESDGDLHYNPSTGLLTTGAITAATVTQTSIANVGSDTDKFIVSDSGVFKYRTGTQVASDIGLGSSASPQFTAIELGHATDTTIARSSGGVVTIEGATVRTGTVAVGVGGTGITDTPANGTLLIGDGTDYTNAALTEGTNITISVGSGSCTITSADTNTNQLTTFTLTADSGSNQTIAHGNTLDIEGGTGIVTEVGATDTVTVSADGHLGKLAGESSPSADRLVGWDNSASGAEMKFMTPGTGLSISGTTLNVSFGDITSTGTVASGTWEATDIAVAHGGTGASSAGDARTNLGLGDLAEQDTVNNGDWSGTDLSVANGGTGASNSNAWLNSRVTINADGTLNYDATSAAAPNHDSLAGFVANEHIDHTSAGVVAGSGLTGGGDLTASRTLNVIGGNGITANSNDMAVTPAQTTITSLFATDIKIGEDDQTKIDFETANQINFYTNNVHEFQMSSGGAFHADGEITAYSSTVASDERLKTNIKHTKYGLEDVLKMRGVEFNWREKLNGKYDIGFIAQEMKEIAPELVSEVVGLHGEDSHLAVDYTKVVPILVESIKELKEELDGIRNSS